MRIFVIFFTFMFFVRAQALPVSLGPEQEPVSVERWQLVGILPPPPPGLEHRVQIDPFLDVLSFVKGFAILELTHEFSPDHELVSRFWVALTDFAKVSERPTPSASQPNYLKAIEDDLANYYLGLLLRHQEKAIKQVLSEEQLPAALRALKAVQLKFLETNRTQRKKHRRPFWEAASARLHHVLRSEPVPTPFPDAQLFHLSYLIIGLERLTSTHSCLIWSN